MDYAVASRLAHRLAGALLPHRARSCSPAWFTVLCSLLILPALVHCGRREAKLPPEPVVGEVLRQARQAALALSDPYSTSRLLQRVAMLQAQSGDASGAAETLKRLKALPDNVAPGHEYLAELRAEMGDAPGALRAAVSIPNNYMSSNLKVNALRYAARAQVKTGDLKGALRTADMVRSLIAGCRAEGSPDFRKSLTACGGIRAMLAYEKARVLIEIGTTQAKLGDRAGAARTLHLAASDLKGAGIQATEAGVTWLLVQALAEAGDYPAACRTASTQKNDATRNDLFLLIAETRAVAGDKEGALKTARMVRGGSEQEAIQARMASLQACIGNKAEAHQIVEAIHNPNRLVQALDYIAMGQLRTGNRNGAVETLRRAVRIAEDNPAVDKDMTFVFLAEAQAMAGDNEGAIHTAESMREKNYGARVGPAYALRRVAVAQAQAGNRQEAARTIERAARITPEDEKGWLLHFQALAGDAAGALAQANRERDPQRKADYLLFVADGMVKREAEQKARRRP